MKEKEKAEENKCWMTLFVYLVRTGIYSDNRRSGRYAPILLAPAEGWGPFRPLRALRAMLGAFSPQHHSFVFGRNDLKLFATLLGAEGPQQGPKGREVPPALCWSQKDGCVAPRSSSKTYFCNRLCIRIIEHVYFFCSYSTRNLIYLH